MTKNYSEKDYAVIGEYVVVFEGVLHDITWLCCDLFARRGLQQRFLVEVLFGQNNFTGYPKIAAFNSLVVEYMSVFDGNPKTKEFILQQNDFIYKELVKHNEYRNKIVHSTYVTQYSNESEPKHIALKSRGKKQGFTTETLDLDTINEYVGELKSVKNELSKLSIELVHNRENWKFDLSLR